MLGTDMVAPWLGSYDPGVPIDIPAQEDLLAHHLAEASAARYPHRPAIVYARLSGSSLAEARLSFRSLEKAANRFANALVAMGVQKGDRVSLLLHNSPQFVIACIGAYKAGAIVVALDPDGPPDQTEHWLADCGAETVVADHETYAIIKRAQPQTGVTRVIATRLEEHLTALARTVISLKPGTRRLRLDPRDYSFRLMLKGSPDVPPAIDIRPMDLAVLEYPGGLARSHGSLVAGVRQLTAWWTMVEPGNEATLVLAPMARPFGLQTVMLTTLAIGGALLLSPQFDLAEIRLAIERYRPTWLAAEAEWIGALLDSLAVVPHDLNSIRLGLCAGEPSSAQLSMFEQLTGGRLVQAYNPLGGGVLTHAQPMRGKAREGSVGLPLPGTAARVVDPNFPAANRPIREVGELVVKGPQLPRGYWNRRLVPGNTIEEGWWRTGRLAAMDEGGFFYLADE